ncbi:mannose-1-phosphate guanylyltransferase/mannose-6-phosphate isomerase [Govanella unica]|uniref:mannose-1-phosphate guanylyltransferase n=1 Tax=Govanella unica TaxID=2975056 RepID=A0A9X3TXN1_9PROT|nr:mannose-1-phosphate guanylyltransferase/mannose-6-phosphate isomerase [Govania unica]
MSATIHPVILSGGVGTRLWPLSRAQFPKQLLPLVTDRSMLQETVSRISDAARFSAPLIVANEDHRFIIAEQMRQSGITPDSIILEPEGRNTAPAVALAALYLAARDPEAILLVMPSDHVIENTDSFSNAVSAGAAAAAAGKLVTFGITPTAPETGYGYIAAGPALPGHQGVFAVSRFVEKPDLATAEGYIADGNYSWNAGIFMLRADVYLAELERFNPAILDACRAALAGAKTDLSFTRPDAAAFKASPSDSIDYAVMEKTADAAVVPVDMGWSDVGSWSALCLLADKDDRGNAIRGDVIAIDSDNNYIRSEGPVVATVGLEDIVIVAMDDAVVVAHKNKSQNIKAVVEELTRRKRTEHLSHTIVYRPWGSYQSADSGDRYQVKRLVVNPGEKLSLQKHMHRAEHWVVVQGTARVTRDDEIIMLHENQSTYIPVGATHRLENPGKIPLYIIEVQSGGYLGEDDIVRFDDTYGRI